MKKTTTRSVAIEMTQQEHDRLWDIVFAVKEYTDNPKAIYEYLDADDIAFAGKFITTQYEG